MATSSNCESDSRTCLCLANLGTHSCSECALPVPWPTSCPLATTAALGLLMDVSFLHFNHCNYHCNWYLYEKSCLHYFKIICIFIIITTSIINDCCGYSFCYCCCSRYCSYIFSCNWNNLVYKYNDWNANGTKWLKINVTEMIIVLITIMMII